MDHKSGSQSDQRNPEGTRHEQGVPPRGGLFPKETLGEKNRNEKDRALDEGIDKPLVGDREF